MTAMPQLSIASTSGILVVSSSNAQWKAPEQVSDSGVANPATQLAHIGSPPLTNSAGSEPMPTVSQGLGHTVGAHSGSSNLSSNHLQCLHPHNSSNTHHKNSCHHHHNLSSRHNNCKQGTTVFLSDPTNSRPEWSSFCRLGYSWGVWSCSIGLACPCNKVNLRFTHFRYLQLKSGMHRFSYLWLVPIYL